MPRRVSRARGFTLLELMWAVAIISVGIVFAVQTLVPQVLRATTLKAYPYARETMAFAAGHHTLHGTWPIEVPNHFVMSSEDVDLTPLIRAQWPKAISSFPGQRADVTGTIFTHQGSFLVTTELISGKRDTIAWFVTGGVEEGLPVPFIWRCGAGDSEARGGLPDPTTLARDRFPTNCHLTGQEAP